MKRTCFPLWKLHPMAFPSRHKSAEEDSEKLSAGRPERGHSWLGRGMSRGGGSRTSLEINITLSILYRNVYNLNRYKLDQYYIRTML